MCIPEMKEFWDSFKEKVKERLVSKDEARFYK